MKQINKLLKIAVWLTIVFFAIRCWFSWDDIRAAVSLYELFGFAGEAIGAASVCTVLYEKWLWRCMPFESTPKLKKRYKGYILSSYDGKKRAAQLDIRQTLMTIHITLSTKESKSNSLNASIEEINGEMQLIYSYLNTTSAGVRDRSPLHYGTAMLCVTDVSKLVGQYYNDRKYTGDMQFTAEEN